WALGGAHGREAEMTRMRRMRIVLLTTAVGVWTAAVVGPLGSASFAEAATTSPPPKGAATGARTVELHVESPMTVAVDPDVSDGMAHHPLELQAHALDINASPLVSSNTPSGYDPITITKYLGLT